jgi:type I restriction enzyme S subunit
MSGPEFSAGRLLRVYDRISDAPDAVVRLRRFVLDLAVRGKLVEQDARDEPASVLLKRIAAEKARLVKAGEIKRQKPLRNVTADDVDFKLPIGWSTASLSEIAICLDYLRVPINGTEREQRTSGKNQSELFPYFGATQQQGWIDDYIFDGELALLGEDGIPFHDPLRDKAYLVSGKSWVNNHAHVFKGILVSPQFLVHYLNVFDYTGRVVGATRAKLNQAQALTIPFSLPPLAEQHRIVARVDELMALCDRLEQARAGREATRDRLTTASLARLTAPDADADEASFHADARFALDALPALTARPDQIKTLRQTILNLAVRGKLVEQDAGDEPASELLKRIAIERERLLKSREIRKQKSVIPVDGNEDKPFELPSSWRWARFNEVAAIQSNLVDPKRFPEYPHVAPDNIEGWTARLLPYTTIRDAGVFSSKHFFSSGSILYSKIRPNLAKVTVVDFDGLCSADMYPIRPHIDRGYLLKFMITAAFVDQSVTEDNRVAMPKINQVALSNILIAVPPLAEQHRIVAKVDALMALCDGLEAALATADATRRRLLEALLHEALEPAAADMEAAE